MVDILGATMADILGATMAVGIRVKSLTVDIRVKEIMTVDIRVKEIMTVDIRVKPLTVDIRDSWI